MKDSGFTGLLTGIVGVFVFTCVQADVSDWCPEGQKAFAAGKFEEANVALNSCLYSPPEDAIAASEGYYLRGETYMDTQDYQAAISDFDKAVELDPDNADAWRSKAWAHFKRDELHLAITAITTSVEIDSQNTESHHVHAQILVAMDRDNQAMDAYDMAYSFEDRRKVQALQQALADQGYPVGSNDGVYGSRTRDALKACIAAGCIIEWN